MSTYQSLPDLFNTPIKKVEIRKGIYAYSYRNGVINICGQKYLMYSIKDAVKEWRQSNPLK